MDSFISHIIRDISPDELPLLKDRAYVFPTRRACYYFREALKNNFSDQTFWAPKILSIEDFVADCAGQALTDDIQLMFELYQVYIETYAPHPEVSVKKEELPTFDLFYAWGQVLLSDFDEVDRYLVDADKLYQNLQELRDLENLYADNEEVLFALKRFNDMMGRDPTDLMTNFSNQWNRVCKTYHAFKARLQSKGLRYSGLLYRQLADDLSNGGGVPYQQVVFAGFNALSTSEEQIFESLYRSGVGRFYWDADSWYLDNDLDEAGRFLQRYYKKWGPSTTSTWVITRMLKEKKQLRLIGGVQSLGQAQITGQLLHDITDQQQGHTAIILGDETLMFPVLYALPDAIEKLNVTMGAPLKQSQWFRIIQAYLQFQWQIRGRGDKVYFDVEALQALLSISLMQAGAYSSIWQILNDLKKSRSRWISGKSLLDKELPSILKLALTPEDRTPDLLKNLRELMVTLYHKLRLDSEHSDIELEFAFHSIKHLQQLETRLHSYGQQIEIRTLIRLVAEAFHSAKVPFSGEPIGGVQLMGFLETRTLDFERIYILSANEGKLPKGVQHRSFIPFALRKTFKMPTFEEQDAIYSYHFKRILQRAKTVSILYNTEVAVDGSGEKSRFLWQLQQAYGSDRITEEIFQMPLQETDINAELSIEKSSSVMEQMHHLYTDADGERKSLSPTAVRHYLDCSLRFYFRYILRLPERRKARSEMDAADFGNVVHHALEKLYQDFVQQDLDREKLKRIMASERITESVKAAFQDFYKEQSTMILEGKDVLHELIVQKLLFKILAHDLNQAPFKVLGTEQKLGCSIDLPNGKSIALEGTLDRVQQQQGTVGIIDYKTGRADVAWVREAQFPGNTEAYLEQHFQEPRFKSGFQGFFYGYLWNKMTPGQALRIGVYPLKKVNDGVQWLNHGEEIPKEALDLFGEKLQKVLLTIFDPENPFTQTDDTQRCRFCAYREICQR